MEYNNENLRRLDNMPGSLLPNPGEGGSVFPGNEPEENENMGIGPVTPVAPLPNPGEGGPVFPGNRPNIPQENPSRPNLGGLIQTIITTFPRPNLPCRFCGNNTMKAGTIRMLNAASGYNPFSVYVNSEMLTSPLSEGEISEYEKVPAGVHTISIVGDNGYVYVQKQIMVQEDKVYTLAIINTPSGLDLMVVEDRTCDRPFQNGCVRVCNLANNSGSINVFIGQRYISFMNVAFREVTDYKSIWPGDYTVNVSRNNTILRSNIAGEILLTTTMKAEMNVSYTLYVFHWNQSSPDAIRMIIVEEK